MSSVTVQAEKVFEDALNALIREEKELERVEQTIVSKYRKWWNRWMHKNYSDKEIVDSSIHYGLQRCYIEMDIDKLKALTNMCTHAIQEGTTIALSREDYELIYKES